MTSQSMMVRFTVSLSGLKWAKSLCYWGKLYLVSALVVQILGLIGLLWHFDCRGRCHNFVV